MSTYYDYDDTGRPGGLRLAGVVAAGVVALCVAFIIGYSVHGGHTTTAARSTAPTQPASPTQTPSGRPDRRHRRRWRRHLVAR